MKFSCKKFFPANIHTRFQFLNSPGYILQELRNRGEGAVAVLMSDGEAEFIIQDAETYQKLLDKLPANEEANPNT